MEIENDANGSLPQKRQLQVRPKSVVKVSPYVKDMNEKNTLNSFKNVAYEDEKNGIETIEYDQNAEKIQDKEQNENVTQKSSEENKSSEQKIQSVGSLEVVSFFSYKLTDNNFFSAYNYFLNVNVHLYVIIKNRKLDILTPNQTCNQIYLKIDTLSE